MSRDDIGEIERVDIDLLKLKPPEALKEVYDSYKKELEKYFDNNGNPKEAYFEKVECPICGSCHYEQKVTIDFFKYVECSQCNVVYNSPRLRSDIVEEMYKAGNYLSYFEKLTLPSQDIRKNVIERRKFRQINSFFVRPGKILDVGCGSGSFLKEFQENGWDVCGLDPSESAAKTAESLYGLEIIQDYFEQFNSEEKFDCITFWGLEHLSDPLNGMNKATELLNDNGLIVFEGPSSDSFLMKYLCKNKFSPYRYVESARHVLFFSRNSIDFLCKKFNLEVGYIETIGLDIQTILLYEFEESIIEKIMVMQKVINDLMLGDHYRVFLKKT